MAADTENILNLVDLTIGYSSGRSVKSVLSGLNATACKGELIAVIGKNGAGKSTLLRTITGLQASLSGNILHEGIDITEYSRIELARRVGYISTESVRVNNMSVYDLVSLGRFPYTNWTGRIDKKNNLIIEKAIEDAGMSALKNRYVGELSDGERQRSMIARILAQDTCLMVMDEPTAFLDIGSKYEILLLLHNLAKDAGKTVIFSSHDLQIAITQADKIWLIADESFVEGAPEDLMLGGEFDQIFSSSSVKYNSDLGTFSFPSEEKGRIWLEGEGIMRHWTEKALNRAGFLLSDIKSHPVLYVPDSKSESWRLVSENNSIEFRSIFELITALTRTE